jgi:hypothetical protein
LAKGAIHRALVVRVIVAQEVEVAAEPTEIIGTVDLLVCLVFLVLEVVNNVHSLVLVVNLDQFAITIAVGLTESKLACLCRNSHVFLKGLVFVLNASTLVIRYEIVHAVLTVLTHFFIFEHLVHFLLLILTSIA